jgi:beta-phosphoglucomutase-like phosphatase (HAD superfamily)
MLGIADQIDSVMCGDDGLPPKPAPEQIWKICHDLNVHPANAIMVT